MSGGVVLSRRKIFKYSEDIFVYKMNHKIV
jgi:hypothetical protein